MRTLSKSNLLAFHQCPRKLWLDVHGTETAVTSEPTHPGVAMTADIRNSMHRHYDTRGRGVRFNPQREGFGQVVAGTAQEMKRRRPLFGAAFSASGTHAVVDALLPVTHKGRPAWRLVMATSARELKDHHYRNAAVQYSILRAAGVPVVSIQFASVDNDWVFPGGDDYRGLLKPIDVTKNALALQPDVQTWLSGAQKVIQKRKEPQVQIGPHCNDPHACGYIDRCGGKNRPARYPVAWLPGSRSLKDFINERDVSDMRKVPDAHLNDVQLRVKQHTLGGSVYFDRAGASSALGPRSAPPSFLDFECINGPVPVWKGTSPNQVIPFQFSLHRLNRNGRLEHHEFLDLSGDDPSARLATALVKACKGTGPVFVWGTYEGGIIKRLAERFPELAPALLKLHPRLVDLHRVTRVHYYHPDQCGSWSLKSVLPTIAPELAYDALDGVSNGLMAMTAYREAIHPQTSQSRKQRLHAQLLTYCQRDTEALYRIWQYFTGRRRRRAASHA